MTTTEIDGRFLPARVFKRWKWVVRLAISIVPLTLFLAGALQIYLSPNQFSSTSVFEITNGPNLREIEERLQTGNVISRVVDRLQIHNQLRVDRESSISIIRENLESEILEGTRMIRLKVTLSKAVLARDVAAEIPKAVVEDIASDLKARSDQRITEIRQLESAEADRARELSSRWIKLQEFHGRSPSNPGAAAAIEQARTATLLAETEVAKLNALAINEQTRLIQDQARLRVHTEPQISLNAVDSRQPDPFGKLILECIGWALAIALAVPYLLEWLFPSARREDPAPAAVLEI